MTTAHKTNFNGPTAERIIQSDGHIAIGDDLRGGKLYTFLDSSLDRIYARLSKSSDRWLQDQLRVEYAALTRFYEVYVQSSLNGSIGSVDPNRTYSPSPGGRSFLAATESQLHARNQYRAAQGALDHHEAIVVQNVVCNDHSLEIAGYAVGKNSKTRAIEYAGELLRDAGFKMAKFWGLVR